MKGRGVNFEVDSGSTVTVISTKVYDKISERRKPALKGVHGRFMLADGGSMRVRGRCDASLMLSHIEVDNEVVAADIKTEGLLGSDFMMQHNCVLDFRKGVLEVDGEVVRVREESVRRQCGRCDDGEASFEPQQMVGESKVFQAMVEEGDVHHSFIGPRAYEESSESEEVTRQCKEALVTAGESDDSERGCSGPCIQTRPKVLALNNEVCRQCGRCDDGEASLEPQQAGGESEVFQATVEEGDAHHSVIGPQAYEESSESDQVTRQFKETLVTAGESDDSERGCSGPLVRILQNVFVINNEVFQEKPDDQVADEESVGTGVENRQKKKQREPVFSSWLGGWTIDHLLSRHGGDPTIAKILEWKTASNVRPEWTIVLAEDKLVKSF